MGKKKQKIRLDLSLEETEHKFYNEKRYNIQFQPLTQHQQEFWTSLNKNVITIGYGSAGVGKTYIACLYGAMLLGCNKIRRLILARPNISISKSLGSFPGGIEEKMAPWIQTMISYLKDFLGNGTVDNWMRGNHPRIEMLPMEVVRGRQFTDCVCICDEAQQLLPEEVKSLTTRVGEHSKLILCGDPAQRDRRTNALEDFIGMCQKYAIKGVGWTEFTTDDIVRSEVVKNIIIAYETEESA